MMLALLLNLLLIVNIFSNEAVPTADDDIHLHFHLKHGDDNKPAEEDDDEGNKKTGEDYGHGHGHGGATFTAKLCDNDWAGTYDNVKFGLRDGRGFTCETDWVAGPKAMDPSHPNPLLGWPRGERRTWDLATKLGDCLLLDDTHGLEFRVVVDTFGINLHMDDLELCKFALYNPDPRGEEPRAWTWSGSLIMNEDLAGVYASKSKWIPLMYNA